LREELSALLRDLRENGTAPNASLLDVPSTKEQQQAFVHFVTSQMGFDYDRGRLDVSTHPFCSGSHCNDVRLTTRFHESNSTDALGSTMHEAGHGIYEQGLLYEHVGTPMGSAVSLGIHESQSRMWENMVGRSRGFWEWLCPKLPEFFGDAFAAYGPRDFYGATNLANPSFIRVEADELTYNLHVMVRFEIELALMRGELEAAEIPQVWNEKYRDSLGIEVPDDAMGCLQDVHWSAGLFGYFPTYTLGNIYAAQIYAKAEQDLGDQSARFHEGDFAPLKTWLNKNIHAQGQRYQAPDLIRSVCGEEPDSSYLIRYLSGKLRPIYGIG
jgi:carboxypeptidase Taq